MGIEFNEIVPAWEDLTETGDVEAGARFEKSFLVGFAKAGGVPIEFRRGFAFIAEAAKEFFVGRRIRQIAEARDVDAERLCRTTGPRLCAAGGQFPPAAPAAPVRA